MQEESVLLAQTEGAGVHKRTSASWHGIPRDHLPSLLCPEMVGAFTLLGDFAHFLRHRGLNWWGAN